MQCFFYNLNELIDESHTLWKRLIPSDRCSTRLRRSSISYGDYFSAIFSTLKYNKFKILLNIIAQQTNKFLTINCIKYISISLEKHGAFYHPSKLEVCLKKCECSLFFVVNVAISKEGLITIKEEVNTLKLLNRNVPLGFLPKVYAYSANNSLQLSMFFGEWFTNFHEFHLSMNKKTRNNEILIWNYSLEKHFLSEKQTRQLYYQIAMIVSLYYDFKSTKQISSWHNASGDFIVNISENFIQTRLISVRHFSPMLVNRNVKNKELSWDIVLHSLTIFLLYVSVHIRLDRLDGVGNIVLTSCNYIAYIVRGFFQGFCLALINSNYSIDFIVLFKNYLLSYSKNDLLELTFKIISKIYNNRGNENSVIIPNLDEHVESLYVSLKRLSVLN